MNEQAVVFDSDNCSLVGILHHVEKPQHLGVVIVVGGPQTRVGSHRQFVLLARMLTVQGYTVFRFDYQGMGDSDGELSSFEKCGDDIKAAIDIFMQKVPELKSVVLWGLCDAASASAFYGHQDTRVLSMVMLNPWVRTDAGEAKAYVKHYYLTRVLDKKFWAKMFAGQFDFKASIVSFRQNLTLAFAGNKKASAQSVKKSLFQGDSPLPQRVLKGLQWFKGEVLFIFSGDDLTANEFRDVAKSSAEWSRVMSSDRITQQLLEEANHTFSKSEWRAQVEKWTLQWLEKQIKRN